MNSQTYRARVGRFQQSISDRARPETSLMEAINLWRDELVSAADLQTTDLERERLATVYKHQQTTGLPSYMTVVAPWMRGA